MYSYSTRITNLASLVREAVLRRRHSGRIGVKHLLEHTRRIERLLFEYYGIELKERDVLDIGVGQFLIQMQYFALNNKVTGIDSNVIVQGLEPALYAKMLFLNGPVRVAKTVIRKLLGIDRQAVRDLKAGLGVNSLPKLPVSLMDACNLSFEDSSFDFIHCHAVLHHVKKPASALAGMSRVLRPKGALYAQVHLYSSETGCLDPRVFSEYATAALPPWAHLRPRYAGLVNSNAYLNKLRLSEWLDLFSAFFPGAVIIPGLSERPGAAREAAALSASGEIEGFSVKEMLTHDITVLWRKP